MDEFGERLRDEMRGEHAPGDPHGRVMDRVRRRGRRRRVAAAGVGLGLTGLLAFGGYVSLRGGPADRGPLPPATDATTVEPTTAPTTAPTTSASTEPTEPPSTEPPETLPGAPPPVTVGFGDDSVELFAYTYCYGNACVDGSPGDLFHVGSPDHVTVEFPLDDWSFTAYFTPSGDDCGRVQSAPLTETYRAGNFVLEPVGFADTYDVQLFGKAKQGGDLFVSFRWTTPVDGPLPEPRAYLALLANDDPVTSYGVELYVSNLAETPSSARAIVTVRASNGRQVTFEAKRADDNCLPEGTVFWDGPDAKGLAAAALGDPPFTYEVELILDGERYLASATWPDDEIAGEEPGVLLHFSPDLPALGEG